MKLLIITLCLLEVQSDQSCGVFDGLNGETENHSRISVGKDDSRMVPWVVNLDIAMKNKEDQEQRQGTEFDDKPDGEVNEHLRCAGTIIDRWNVLTAAHCLVSEKHELVSVDVSAGRYLFAASEVKANINRQFKRESLTIKANKETIFAHKDYNATSLSKDVAILRLPVPFKLSTSNDDNLVFPACLPTEDKIDQVNRSDCFSFSLGSLLCEHGALQITRMEILPNDESCSVDKDVSHVMFCAAEKHSLTSKRQDTCSKDSGGGLVCRLKESSKDFVLMGVLSNGQGNCLDKPEAPGLFANVTTLMNWIRENKKTGPKKGNERKRKKPKNSFMEKERRNRLERYRKVREEREKRREEKIRKQIKSEEKQSRKTTEQPASIKKL